MKVTATALPGVMLIDLPAFSDARGSFLETFRANEYESAGLSRFVQDNVSYSLARVLRGLHFQHPTPQAKLVYAVRGEILDVAVDVRVGSATFGRALWTTLSDTNHRQVFIPEGFAHGFVVTSEDAVVTYKCSAYYSPGSEQVIRWNDPALGIPWPITDPIIAPRDASAPLLHEIPHDRLPRCV